MNTIVDEPVCDAKMGGGIFERFQSSCSTSDWDFTLVLNVFECLISVISFAVASNLIGFDFVKFLRLFRRWSPDEIEFRRLNLKIAEISKKMSVLSPVNDFAQYFKHERVRNKLVDEQNSLSQRISQDALLRSFKLTMFFRAALFLISMALAMHVGDRLILLRISENHFFPFNFLLHFPGSVTSLLGFQDYDTDGQVTISLFSYLLMALFVRRVYTNRKKDLEKKAA
uniref:Tail-anchored protein insertion receptor WRB n=1 Tax=Ditylenchus dipsaci TaxID=166011 RepID=A0A915E038_9BILA